MTARYYVGLDLGPIQDWSALTVDLLRLLANWDPVKRQSIAHVYPLPDDMQVRDDVAVQVANTDVEPLDD
jgi:hypothetical protein